MARQKKTPAFEQSLNELQALVERLESGDLSLEESLTTFEQGLLLIIITLGIYAFWANLGIKKWVATHTHFAN